MGLQDFPKRRVSILRAGPAAVCSMFWLPLLLLVCSGLTGGNHPSDGPDTDVVIHVEPDRVRFFIEMNLAFIDEIVDVPREADDDLHPVEAPWVREALIETFTDKLGVVIDGQPIAPVDAGFQLFEPDLSFLPLYPKMGKKALVKMQLTLDFPVAEPPQQVAIKWGHYPRDLAISSPGFEPPMKVVANLFASGIQTMIEFTVEEPGFTWHATGETATDLMLPVPTALAAQPLRWPLATSIIVLAGLISVVLHRFRLRGWVTAAACLLVGFFVRDQLVIDVPILVSAPDLPSVTEAEEIFVPLHANVYRAFDYTAESDIYDALALSVDGDLLEELYGQVYRGLIQQEQGGAVSRVQEVRPLQVVVGEIGAIDGQPGFAVDARWQVDGRVTHWGHSHDRTNEYAARYTVVQTQAGWRIGGSQILESRTVSATPEGAGG